VFVLEDQGNATGGENLLSGQCVKLGFSFPAGDATVCESMWVRITDIDNKREAKYTGEIDNVSIFHPDSYGQQVQFRPDHILAIWEEEHDV